MWGRNWKKNAHYIFYLHIFISWKKGSALNIFSIFYTHHRRIPNKHMMTINFDTITNYYEVIHVIKTVMKYHSKKWIRIFISLFQIWFNVYLMTS